MLVGAVIAAARLAVARRYRTGTFLAIPVLLMQLGKSLRIPEIAELLDGCQMLSLRNDC